MLLAGDFFNAFQVAIFAVVFDWCMEEGNILHFYKKWLEKKKFEWQNGEFITKPFGLCSFCFTFYIAFVFGVFLIGLYPLELFLFAFTSMFFNRLLNKIAK